jgi:hypothetical protein
MAFKFYIRIGWNLSTRQCNKDPYTTLSVSAPPQSIALSSVVDPDPHPHQIKIRIRIRIWIRIKVISWIQNRIRFRINFQMTSQNVWNMRLF